MEKIDFKDKQIIYYLYQDCRTSFSELAKIIQVPKEVVAYRIKKLKENGIITKYGITINPEDLGLMYGRMYIKFKNFNEKDIEDLKEFVKNRKKVYIFHTYYGDYDFSIALVSETILGMKEFEDQFFETFGDKILNYDFLIRVKIYGFALDYLIDSPTHKMLRKNLGNKKLKIDDIDKKLIKELAKNARISSVILAKKFDLTPNAISYRIKNLKERGVISRFDISIDIPKLGVYRFKILIYFGSCSMEEKRKFMGYLRLQNSVSYIAEFMGNQNLELVLHLKSIIKVHEFMRKLSQKFPGIIKNFKVLLMDKILIKDTHNFL